MAFYWPGVGGEAFEAVNEGRAPRPAEGAWTRKKYIGTRQKERERKIKSGWGSRRAVRVRERVFCGSARCQRFIPLMICCFFIDTRHKRRVRSVNDIWRSSLSVK